MTISLRLNDDEGMLFKQYAEMRNLTVSELIRQTVLEHMQDEYDLQHYEAALRECREQPAAYSLDEADPSGN